MTITRRSIGSAWNKSAAGAAVVIVAASVGSYATGGGKGGMERGPILRGVDRVDVASRWPKEGEKISKVRSQVFVLRRGEGDKVVDAFDPKRKDRIRLVGFGLTSFNRLQPGLHQDGPDVYLDLPGEQKLWVKNADLATLGPDRFELELDRKGLIQTFGDEFDSFSWCAEKEREGCISKGTWRTNYGWGPPTAKGSRSLNDEMQVYADPNFRGTGPTPFGLTPFRVRDGVLEISGERAPDNVAPHIWGKRYISGLITTKFSFSQLYGLFEMRARIPQGHGFWPGFWLLPRDGGWPPELDVLEALGDKPNTVYTTTHTSEGGEHRATGVTSLVPDMSADFHVYTADWQKDVVIWYVDGVEVGRAPTPADMHKPMYLLANLAIGGGWAGEPYPWTSFPAVYAIDWIRAYRREQTADASR